MDFFTPPPSLSARYILFVGKFAAFLDPLPLICGRHIWKPPYRKPPILCIWLDCLSRRGMGDCPACKSRRLGVIFSGSFVCRYCEAKEGPASVKCPRFLPQGGYIMCLLYILLLCLWQDLWKIDTISDKYNTVLFSWVHSTACICFAQETLWQSRPLHRRWKLLKRQASLASCFSLKLWLPGLEGGRSH